MRLLLLTLLILSPLTHATSFEVGKIYRLKTTLENLVSEDGIPATPARAVKTSKFKVIQNDAGKTYILVNFINLYSIEINEDIIESTVRKDKNYKISKAIDDSNHIALSAVESDSGWASGALIVPFKYRLNDKSLGGEATIGTYLGYNFELFASSEAKLIVIPFLAAGLSQISIQQADGSNKNQSGVTIAGGFLFPKWDETTLGLIYGQDRIGDSDWEHEGKGWVSILVGLKF
jgi:hypothetical protein